MRRWGWESWEQATAAKGAGPFAHPKLVIGSVPRARSGPLSPLTTGSAFREEKCRDGWTLFRKNSEM